MPKEWLDTADAIARGQALSLAGIAKAVEAIRQAPLPCSLGTLLNGLIATRPVVQATPLLTQKKRPEEEFIARQHALTLSRQAASEGVIRLIYFDEASFCASPPVQYSWSPRCQPHATGPAKDCTRSVLGALDFGAQQLHTQVHTGTINRERVINFLDGFIRQGDDRPTLIVLDNARIHHNIPDDILDRWCIDHRAFLIHLPPYSPELNLIEIVWKKLKYHWRRFLTPGPRIPLTRN